MHENETILWVDEMETAIIAELQNRNIYVDYDVKLSNSMMCSKSLYITFLGSVIGRISDHSGKSDYYNEKASHQTGNFDANNVPQLIENILNETIELRNEIEAEY